jgi:hypothetical protein
MQKSEKKPSADTVGFRRFRRVPNIDKALDGWDYGLMVGIKLRKPKPRR